MLGPVRDVFWTVAIVLGIFGCSVLLPSLVVLLIIISCLAAFLLFCWIVYAYVHDRRLEKEDP